MNTINMKSNYLCYLSALFLSVLVSCAPEEKVEAIADYSGTWKCTETTSNPSGNSTFSVRLKKDGTSNTAYFMENIYNLNFSNQASLTIDASAITIASQTIGTGNSSFKASGSGTVNSSTKLTMSYKMEDGSGAVDNCSATFEKQ
jgi:hypothetical protein